MNFSVQNKQNKKDTFFSNPKFWHFYDFLKLEVFPEENPTQNFQIHWDRAKIGKKIQSEFTDLFFLARNSQNFEKDYKVTFTDKTSISNIPKIQIIS